MALDFSPVSGQPNWLGLVQAGMEARRRADGQRAFGEYAANPSDPTTLARLAQYEPEYALRAGEQQRRVQREQQTQALAGRAISGDQQAGQQLAGLDPELWMRIDGAQRMRMKQQNETVGQLAYWADTPEKWQQALGQARSLGIDVAGYDDFGNREAVLAQSGLLKDFIASQEPKWMAIGENGIVDVRNPAAIQAYQNAGGGTGEAPSAVSSPSAGSAFSVSGVRGERVTSTYRDPARNAAVGGVPNSYHTRRDANGRPLARDSVPPSGMGMSEYANAIRQRNPGLEVINEGDHVHVEPRSTSRRAGITRSQYDELPSGATFKAPDGTMRRKP